MKYFNYNGKIFEDGTPVIGPDNRGLRYGDGLFETIRYSGNQLILADEHFARLWKGIKLLGFNIPKLFTPEKLESQIRELVEKNKQVTARIRLSIFRGNGGLYDADNHTPNYTIQSWPAGNYKTLNDNGLQLCIYRDARKVIDRFSNIKHNNYLPYFMGALYAKENQYNDAIILNDQNRICDSTIANIFIIKDGIIHTPSLAEGCIAGTMRDFIMRELSKPDFIIEEGSIDQRFILEADEVFLSNSIYNIRWVASIEGKKYSSNLTRKIFESLQQTNSSVFC